MAFPTMDPKNFPIRKERVLLDILRSYLLIAAAVELAVRSGFVWAAVPAILAIGSQQYALHILLHDGLHGRLLDSKKWNDLLSRFLLAYPLFVAFLDFRKKHLDHHRYLGTEQDPDRYYHRTSDKATRFRFLLFVCSIPSLLATLHRSRPERADGESIPSSRRPGWTDWGMVLVYQALLLLLFAWRRNAEDYVWFWVLPYGIGVFAAQNLRSFAEHAHPEPDSAADRHRLVTFRSHPWERVFLAPNNMNYHAEHHLFPWVPYYHLPALRKRLEETRAMNPVEIRGSYTGFLLRYWLRLPIPHPTPAEPVSASADTSR